jgi:DNA-binding beta-propeller fold protein YncE
MPKTAKKKSSSSKGKATPKPAARKGSKKILFLFGILGLFITADLISVIYNKANEAKVISVQKVQEFTGDGQASGAFKGWDILALPNNTVALTDQGQNRILLFDRQGKFLFKIDQEQSGLPPFKEPSCLTADPNGNLYVMDTWNTMIRGFNSNGDSTLKLDMSAKGFYGPRGLAWDNNAFVIADTGSHRVAKVSLDGNTVGAWGTRGSGKGMFNNPYEIATDGHSNYYVVDRDNNRIQVLDSQGRFVREIRVGAPPTAEAIDPQRRLLYVTSQDGQFVKVYDLEGKYIGAVFEAGQKGQALSGIGALSVFPDGDIAMLRDGSRVQIYHTVPTPEKTQ